MEGSVARETAKMGWSKAKKTLAAAAAIAALAVAALLVADAVGLRSGKAPEISPAAELQWEVKEGAFAVELSDGTRVFERAALFVASGCEACAEALRKWAALPREKTPGLYVAGDPEPVARDLSWLGAADAEPRQVGGGMSVRAVPCVARVNPEGGVDEIYLEEAAAALEGMAGT
jgi:hypothetical protein